MYVWKNSVDEERWNTEFISAWRKFSESVGLKMHPAIDCTQAQDACEALDDDEEYTLVDDASDPLRRKNEEKKI